MGFSSSRGRHVFLAALPVWVPIGVQEVAAVSLMIPLSLE